MKLRKNIQMLVALFLLMVVAGACDDFLGEAPKKQKNLEITTVEQLNGLLTDVPFLMGNAWLFGSDIYEFSTDARKAGIGNPFSMGNLFLYGLWDHKNLANLPSDMSWSRCYTSIFTMNTILTNVDKVSGDAELKAEVAAAAHYWRATRNWVLVNCYALPYCEENLKEMGISYKATTSFEESAERMTIEDSYKFIEEDLLAALNTSQKSIGKRWRVSLPAIHAFLARFYFYMNNYDEALKYADLALEGNSQLVDYNDPTQMYTKVYTNRIQFNVPYTWFETNTLGTFDYPEFYIVDMQMYNPMVCQLVNDKFVSLFDTENDLRYKFCVIQNFGKRYNYPVNVCGYAMWNDRAPQAPTVPEMLLTKAECQARMGNWQDALNTVNILRAKRMVPGPNANLTASSQQEAVEKIIDERTRELNFSTRWFDMRRLNNNETTYDDFVVVRKYFPYNNSLVFDTKADLVEYKLEVKDRKYAFPILESEIVLSNGQLKQNIY